MHDDKDRKVHIETTDGRRMVFNDAKSYIEIVSGPSKRRIRIDDSKRRIEIETTSGHNIVLDDAGREVKIRTRLFQGFTLDDTARTITMSNHLNSVRLMPTGIQMDSKQDIIIKGNKDLYLQAADTTYIRGKDIKLEKFNKAKHGSLGKRARYATQAVEAVETISNL